MSSSVPPENRVRKAYDELLASYLKIDLISLFKDKKDEDIIDSDVNPETEQQIVSEFLSKHCSCGRDCQNQFSEKELLSTRAQFRALSSSEKNCYILAQLRLLSKNSVFANSSRSESIRKRQKFEYRINFDRPVCRDVFLFYHGETLERLRRLQGCLEESPVQPPEHGNVGNKPINAYSTVDIEAVKLFITNLAEIHGLPDPGRDIRRGKGRLRILLPSVMHYTAIHRSYEESITILGKQPVGYRTFLDIWQKELPHIEFNNPKTDLCMTCENFKKELNKITASCDEEKENRRMILYQEAIDHLNFAKKERLYYKAHSKVALEDYKKKINIEKEFGPSKANSKDIIMSYSWDFAQQLLYPFEDQQVGPIYFKTPRRAQLFGVCCEGIPRQVNYLIDEADSLEKNANTVISLLDHFFSNHGLGEKSVYLTADNCVGQNKNNGLIQYLMYRTLMGLHSDIEMSFLVVGHTKFSPDAYFGLIKQRYRRSQVYTYEQLVGVIEDSSPNGHNICQRYHDISQSNKEIVYRDWRNWLSNYFKTIPNITKYQHFRMSSTEEGVVILKKDIDSKEEKFHLLNNKTSLLSTRGRESDLPPQIIPVGLSPERQWYLYDQIRMHISTEKDRNITCPKPMCSKPKAKKLPAED